MGPEERAAPGMVRWLLSPWLPIGGLFVVHLALARGYGLHRDELYELAAGRSITLGYVDLPPVVPWLAGLARLTPDPHFAMRLLAAAAAAVASVAAVGIAGIVSGDTRGRSIAAWAMSLAPGLVAAGGMFQSVIAEIAAAGLFAWALLRAVRNDRMRDWAVVGACSALAVATKFTALAWLGALGLGFGLTGRHVASRPGPCFGALVGIVLVLPLVVWQSDHGFPTAEFLAAATTDDHLGSSAADFILQLALMLGPLAGGIVILAGLNWRGRRDLRPIIAGAFLVWALVAVAGAKPYYVADTFPMLVGLGSARLAALSPRSQLGVGAAGALVFGILAPVSMPITPAAALASSHLAEVRGDFADMVGWDEVRSTVARVAGSADAIVTENVGEAGALLAVAPAPAPVFSPHLGLWYQGPPPPDARRVIVVGYDRARLTSLFGSVEQVATLENDLGITNDESGVPVWRCDRPLASWTGMWQTLRSVES